MSEQSGAWQPDPFGRHQYRYWDGNDWTDQVSNDGVVSQDPPTGEMASGAAGAGDATGGEGAASGTGAPGEPEPTQPAGWGAPPDPTTSMPAAAAGGAGAGAAGGTPPPAGGEPPRSSGGGNKLPLIIGGVLLLVLIAAAAFLLLGNDGDADRDELVADLQEEAEVDEETAECIVDEMDDEIGLDRLDELNANSDDATSEEEAALVEATMRCMGIGVDDEDDEETTDTTDTTDDDTTDTTEDDEETTDTTDGDGGGEIDLDDPLMELFIEGVMQGSDLDEEQARCFSEEFLAMEGLNFQDLMEDPNAMATDTDFMRAMLDIFDVCEIDPEALGGGGSGLQDGDTYGDNAELDALWDECEAGDGAACDELYFNSAIGSEYEEFGDTCGGRREAGTVLCANEDLE